MSKFDNLNKETITPPMPTPVITYISNDGKTKRSSWEIPHNDDNSKNIFHSLIFKIPSYIPEVMKKYGTDSDNQVTEDAEFEIIQPKQLKSCE